MNKTTLYSIKGYQGAHSIIDMRDTDSGTIATVQLIGSALPFSAALPDLTPYQTTNALPTDSDIITLLAQEAAILYGADPERINKAAELARQPYAIQNARKDFLGEPIKPSLNTLIVKGHAGWYLVSKGSCTCPDSTKRGQVCKHRIAAWMHREAIIRPLAKLRRRTPVQILAELTA